METEAELATVANIAMLNRSDLPIEIPVQLYTQAYGQMEQRMRARGFPVPTAGRLRGVEHFMLNGQVIVPCR